MLKTVSVDMFQGRYRYLTPLKSRKVGQNIIPPQAYFRHSPKMQTNPKPQITAAFQECLIVHASGVFQTLTFRGQTKHE